MGIPIIGDVIDAVKDIVSEVVVDKDKAKEINVRLREIEDQAQARLDAQLQGQIETNKIEAGHGSIFVAGWRPAIGWVGAIALGYSFIIAPFLGIWLKVPDLQYDYLLQIVLAMLGVGAMRSFEKVKGVSTDNIRTPTPRPQAEVLKNIPDKPLVPDKKRRWQKI